MAKLLPPILLFAVPSFQDPFLRFTRSPFLTFRTLLPSHLLTLCLFSVSSLPLPLWVLIFSTSQLLTFLLSSVSYVHPFPVSYFSYPLTLSRFYLFEIRSPVPVLKFRFSPSPFHRFSVSSLTSLPLPLWVLIFSTSQLLSFFLSSVSPVHPFPVSYFSYPLTLSPSHPLSVLRFNFLTSIQFRN